MPIFLGLLLLAAILGIPALWILAPLGVLFLLVVWAISAMLKEADKDTSAGSQSKVAQDNEVKNVCSSCKCALPPARRPMRRKFF